MDKSTANAAMNMASEEVGKPKSSRRKNSNANCKKYKNWLYGFGISVIPLLTLPFIEAATKGITWERFVILVFCNCEILFLGVSLMITSMNDYIEDKTKRDKTTGFFASIILILIGSIAYSILMLFSYFKIEMFLNSTFILTFNIIYLVIIILVSSLQYLLNHGGNK